VCIAAAESAARTRPNPHPNQFLLPHIEDGRFVTLFFARMDPRDRSFTFASAGHEGCRFDPSGKVRPLDASHPPLGFLPEAVIRSVGPLQLEPGQLLLFLTDGIHETVDPQGRDYGIERVLDLVRAHRNREARRIAELLCSSAREHAQGAPQRDDTTAVVLKVNGDRPRDAAATPRPR
jgi:serine phosphatase RsbU (regulator of sigma subunit)